MNAQELPATLETAPGFVKITPSGNMLQILFTQYQSKVVFAQDVVGKFGYGSFLFAREAVNSGDNKHKPYAMVVGNYSENAHCKIQLGGEHLNQKPINSVLLQCSGITYNAAKRGVMLDQPFSRGPVRIGHNVTVSQNAIILSGLTIGNGAVIGAGAVVTKDVPDFAIMAGCPARLLRYRFEEPVREALNRIRWWDLKPSSFLHYYARIQSIPAQDAIDELLNLAPVHYRKPDENCWVYTRQTNEYEQSVFTIVGAEIGGSFYNMDQLPPLVKRYADQRRLPPGSEMFLVDDIFALA